MKSEPVSKLKSSGGSRGKRWRGENGEWNGRKCRSIHLLGGPPQPIYMYTIFLSTYLCATCVLSFFALFTCFFLFFFFHGTRRARYRRIYRRLHEHISIVALFFFLRNLQYVYTRRIEVPSSHTRCIRSNREFLHFRTPIRVCIITARCSAKPGRTQYVLCTISVWPTRVSYVVAVSCNFRMAYEIHSLHSSVSHEIRLT